MTARRSRVNQPHEEWDREQAWKHLSEIEKGAAGRNPDDRRDLSEVARRYDRVCMRAGAATETDVLASLLVIRTLRDKLDTDEHRLIALAREKKVTWARIAKALELSGRQSAERRYLQLDRACTRVDGSLPGTQGERVEQARDQRSRLAEQQWALEHARSIRKIATELVALPDLQQRVDASHEARIINTIHIDGEARRGARPAPKDLKLHWPTALRRCLAEDQRFRADHTAHIRTDENDPDLRRREAESVHRLLGLITYAGNWRHIKLDDRQDLRNEVKCLCEAAGIPLPKEEDDRA